MDFEGPGILNNLNTSTQRKSQNEDLLNATVKNVRGVGGLRADPKNKNKTNKTTATATATTTTTTYELEHYRLTHGARTRRHQVDRIP